MECLSLRLQTEAGLAEQTVAAVVDVARAAEAEAVVEARRPCGGCGAGQVVTQARARRVAPAGGDPPQQCGDRLPLG